MQIKRRNIIRGLRKLGTISQGGDHEKCSVTVDGLVIGTVPIPSDTDFNDKLIGFVAKPLGLSNRPFGEVCACTKGADWYREHLTEKSLL